MSASHVYPTKPSSLPNPNQQLRSTNGPHPWMHVHTSVMLRRLCPPTFHSNPPLTEFDPHRSGLTQCAFDPVWHIYVCSVDTINVDWMRIWCLVWTRLKCMYLLAIYSKCMKIILTHQFIGRLTGWVEACVVLMTCFQLFAHWVERCIGCSSIVVCMEVAPWSFQLLLMCASTLTASILH